MTNWLKKLFLLVILARLSVAAVPASAQTTYTDRFAGSVVATIGKQPVAVSTTAAIILAYSQTIDGVLVSDHKSDNTGQQPDRVLVKNQADQTTNGIYSVNNTGTWTRTQDFSGPSGVVHGQLVMVVGGTQAALWTLTTVDPITIDQSNGMSSIPSNITFAATAIPVSNLSLSSADIFVGNSSDIATAVPMAGDCTLSNTGSITCTKTNGTSFSSAATVAEVDNTCIVGIAGQWVSGSCTGTGGSGTVNSGTANHITYYPASSNVVSSNSSLTVNSGVLSATGFSGPLTGNVVGNLTGNVTGNTSGTAASITGTNPVANGGTGATSLSAHGAIIGEGTSSVTIATPGTAGNVLTSNGTTSDPTFQSLSIIPYTNNVILTSGTSWSVPAGVNQVFVCVQGAGGGGGSGCSNGGPGGSPGGNACALMSVTGGGSASYSLGSGGSGQTAGCSGGQFGGTGGNTTFGTLTVGGGAGAECNSTSPPSLTGTPQVTASSSIFIVSFNPGNQSGPSAGSAGGQGPWASHGNGGAGSNCGNANSGDNGAIQIRY